MASGVPALITLSISHFCEKARWALDRCGVQFSEEAHAPVPHRFACRAAGGRGTVPCLRLPASASARGTATCVDQSTPIARWADERRPAGAAPLFPAGDTGAEVERLCHECDRSLGPAVRLWAYSHLLNTDLVADAMAGPPVPAAERVAMRAGGWWLVRRLMARSMGINRDAGAAALKEIRRCFDEAAALLADGRPYLAGSSFTAADLTFAALAAPAVGQPYARVPPLLGSAPPAMMAEVEELRQHPAGHYVLRMWEIERSVVLR